MQTPQVIFLTFCGLLLLTGLNTSPAPLLRHFIPVHNQLNIPFNKEQTSTNAATVHWYDQRVDHFNPADTRTFKAVGFLSKLEDSISTPIKILAIFRE